MEKTNSQRKRRYCLLCGESFMSESFANRKCNECNKKTKNTKVSKGCKIHELKFDNTIRY